MRAPEFWSDPPGLAATLLSPVGLAYGGLGALRRLVVRPHHAGAQVVCIGNVVAGGAGKTPVAIAVLRRLIAAKRWPHVLTRGYGGRLTGPVRVDPAHHEADEVGDEPLLLAATAPTWVCRDRRAGAKAAVSAGADVLVLDDGFQNPGLHKDVSLLVIDGGFGFGNGRLMPAGPLRESVAAALARATAVVLVGDDHCGVAARVRQTAVPLIQARLVPGAEAATLAGRKVMAFAGIGRPAKFFRTLQDIGADVVKAYTFADHHPYSPMDIASILGRARKMGAIPVTTAKDAVRLPAAARKEVAVLTVTLAWDDVAALDALLPLTRAGARP